MSRRSQDRVPGHRVPPWFEDAKLGIFVHWGLFSVPAWAPTLAPGETMNDVVRDTPRELGARLPYAEWYANALRIPGSPTERHHRATYGEAPYEDFRGRFEEGLARWDPEEWADLFARAGAGYVVLVTKHHDGYCLWPSAEANRSWGRPWNSVDIGPNRDVLGELTEAVRAKGIEMGFYYSLYEWYNPLWVTDRALYIDKHMFPQFKDLVTRYKPTVIFSDGEWDMHSSEWRSEELMAWLLNDSAVKDRVVINDRWGKESRHKHGGYWTTEYGAGLASGTHAWEECRGMAHSFGYSRTESLSDYKSARDLILMLIDIVSRGGNLLLDIGPDGDGTIPVIMEERLIQIGDWLKVNGEAIYGTQNWKKTIQWTEGKRPEVGYGQEYKAKYDIAELTRPPTGDKAVIECFFTTKGDALYAITPRWPGLELVIEDVEVSPNTNVTMLGVAQSVEWRRSGRNVVVQVPALSIDEVPCQHAYVIKITHVR